MRMTLPSHGAFDLVHDLHRLDDAEGIALLHLLTDQHERRFVRRRRRIKRADQRALHLRCLPEAAPLPVPRLRSLLRVLPPAPPLGAAAATDAAAITGAGSAALILIFALSSSSSTSPSFFCSQRVHQLKRDIFPVL